MQENDFSQNKTIEDEQRNHRRELLIMGMVSVSVIIVFLIFVVPNIFSERAGCEYTQCRSNMKNIGTALELFASDNDGLYPPTLNNLTPDYLKSIPQCEGRVEEFKTDLSGIIYVFMMGRKRIKKILALTMEKPIKQVMIIRDIHFIAEEQTIHGLEWEPIFRGITRLRG